jgi:hypothetical protein
MMRIFPFFLALFTLAGFVSGCGWTVPRLDPTTSSPYETSLMVNRIANQVKCELRKAVWDVLNEYQEKKGNPLVWLASWSAKVTLKIIVDEKSNLSPGVLVTPPSAFSLGLNGALSADATRTESIGFFFVFADLLTPKKGRLLPRELPDCVHHSDILIESDLKLKEWLEAVALVSATPESISSPFKAGAPIDVVSHEVQFVVVLGGDLTPTWKLVPVTINPGGPFLGASRTRTDDLLITMGPLDALAPGRPIGPSVAVEQSHLASQIGQAVTSAIRSQSVR